VSRPLAADDFASIRARMEELRRERDDAIAAADDSRGSPPSELAKAELERRSRDRREGRPPPWAPTIFVGRRRSG